MQRDDRLRNRAELGCHAKNGPRQNWSGGPFMSSKIVRRTIFVRQKWSPTDHSCMKKMVRAVKNGLPQFRHVKSSPPIQENLGFSS